MKKQKKKLSLQSCVGQKSRPVQNYANGTLGLVICGYQSRAMNVKSSMRENEESKEGGKESKDKFKQEFSIKVWKGCSPGCRQLLLPHPFCPPLHVLLFLLTIYSPNPDIHIPIAPSRPQPPPNTAGRPIPDIFSAPSIILISFPRPLLSVMTVLASLVFLFCLLLTNKSCTNYQSSERFSLSCAHRN